MGVEGLGVRGGVRCRRRGEGGVGGGVTQGCDQNTRQKASLETNGSFKKINKYINKLKHKKRKSHLW